MTSKEKALSEKAVLITDRLKERYSSECALEYQGEPWKLLVLARLSAQCTDKRVNIVAVPLFERYPTLESMAECDIQELENIIKPCGLYRMKAKDIKESCRTLIEKYNGVVPDNMDDLLTLSGVGRKIANLLLGDIYGLPAIVADTHCIRISGRLGFTSEKEKNPLKVEKALKKYVPEEEQSDFCHRIVQFGREVCSARSPMCENCFLSDLCEYNKN
ncbi:MAG: endonuclease III [Ruminococcaceae bacterium]|nr:endonuclease III [Oscillospiraceae bacterium]